MNSPKFTKSEKKKLALVFEKLRNELRDNLNSNDSRYDNERGCVNCGDTGPFHNLLSRLEQEVGIRK